MHVVDAAFRAGCAPRQMPVSNGKALEPDWSKIRRRIEDKLRKEASQEQLLEIAKILGVKLGFGLD